MDDQDRSIGILLETAFFGFLLALSVIPSVLFLLYSACFVRSRDRRAQCLEMLPCA